MVYLFFLLGGITFAALGWPLAWLGAHTYCRVSDRFSASRLRLLVMALLGIAPTVLVFVLLDGSGYRPAEERYMLGGLMAVTAFPTGWILTAAVIERAIFAK